MGRGLGEVCTRHGETLLQGHGRLGNGLIWMVLAALFVFGHFYNLYLIVLLGTTWDLLFHLPAEWSSASVFFSVAGFVMMFWGGYPVLEYFCKIAVAAKGISLIIAAVLSHPDSAGILKGTFIMTDLCRSYIPRLRQKVGRENKPAITKNDPIYRWSIAFWAFSPLYILFVHAQPVWLVLMVSSMVVVVIPALALPLLLSPTIPNSWENTRTA